MAEGASTKTPPESVKKQPGQGGKIWKKHSAVLAKAGKSNASNARTAKKKSSGSLNTQFRMKKLQSRQQKRKDRLNRSARHVFDVAVIHEDFG